MSVSTCMHRCECGDPRLTSGIILNTFATLLTEAASLNKTQFSPRWSALLAVLFWGSLSTFYLPNWDYRRVAMPTQHLHGFWVSELQSLGL